LISGNAAGNNKTINMKQLFILVVALAGTLLLVVLMRDQGKPLTTCNTPQGILNLEFASTPALAQGVVNEWKTVTCNNITNINTAIANTKLDFVFIAFYVLFFYITSLILSQSMPGIAGSAGMLLKWGIVAAGILDIAENLLMFNTLNGSITTNGTFCTSLFAKIKFAIVLACFLYLLMGVLWLLFSKKAKLVVQP
jgi:hypothetical protein